MANALLDAIWGQTVRLTAIQEWPVLGHDVAGGGTPPDDLGKI